MTAVQEMVSFTQLPCVCVSSLQSSPEDVLGKDSCWGVSKLSLQQHVGKGRHAEGDSTWQRTSIGMQMHLREVIPSTGRKMCLSLPRTEERGRQLSAGCMQKDHWVAAHWQAVRHSVSLLAAIPLVYLHAVHDSDFWKHFKAAKWIQICGSYCFSITCFNYLVKYVN